MPATLGRRAPLTPSNYSPSRPAAGVGRGSCYLPCEGYDDDDDDDDGGGGGFHGVIVGFDW